MRANKHKNTPPKTFSERALACVNLTSSQLVENSLAAIDTQKINSFITVTSEIARAQSELSDQRIKKGRIRSLEGLPFAIKDNFCTKGIQTTAGSKILHNFIPQYESTVTKRLWEAGAICLGKTNMDEFGMGSATKNSHFGPTINPLGQKLGLPDIVPGGSSGGSAAAVAANQAAAALGTDTGGSIRQPASFCGLFGMKPTYGLCSRWGIISYASSMDQAGVIGRSVEDVANVFDVISGEDLNDSTSIKKTFMSFGELLGSDIRGKKIGIPIEFLDEEKTEEVEIVWKKLHLVAKELGVEIIPVSIPHIKYSLQSYYIIALSEASSNLARYDGVRYGFRAKNISSIEDLYERTRSEGFGTEVKKRILLGTYCLSAGFYDQYYLRATKVRRLISNDFENAFAQVDILAWPTTPTSAFSSTEHTADSTLMYQQDIFTVPVNLVGIPAISIPFSTCKIGLPLGLTLAASRMSDHRLLGFADAISQVQ